MKNPNPTQPPHRFNNRVGLVVSTLPSRGLSYITLYQLRLSRHRRVLRSPSPTFDSVEHSFSKVGAPSTDFRL